MLLRNFVLCLVLVFSNILSISANSAERPGLILTAEGVKSIRENLGRLPLFDHSVALAREVVESEISAGIDTPIPKDYSGGYTHERHKKNFYVAQQAGALYLITQDERYAKYVRDMLFQYEAMYSDLPVHPKPRSYARGKLFWQCLNDSNWLFYMAQAYDAIYDYLSESERNQLNSNLFRPFADFISLDNPQFFNRIHNHSAWGNAAVGMIGLVMGDQDLINRALYGLSSHDGVDMLAKDNDGGFIYSPDGRAGFLANLEEPFSPDGYFTEGPYYQRYATYPFIVFAVAMHNVRPELKVLEHKNKVLLKSVYTLLNLTDADGEFFPLNDGQKGMSVANGSLISAVNIAYFYGNQDPSLISIAEQQGRVMLDHSGLTVAIASRDSLSSEFTKSSVNYSDGPLGQQGGVAILRYGKEDLTTVFKYSAHGLSHGHYDKLSYSLYANGTEVIQDYGLVRFVNIEQKGGGNYLPENNTWAKQTIAHNTLVQDEISHFGGQYDVSSQHHSELNFFDASKPNIHIVSAKENNAYPGTSMLRTLAQIKLPELDNAVLIDIFKASSDGEHQYDLPLQFLGQVIETSAKTSMSETLAPMGADNGYQHLFKEATSIATAGTQYMTWMNSGRFYTMTTESMVDDEWIYTRLGAKDPNFNLRRDAALIIRRKGVGNTVFASLIEPHGSYSFVTEGSNSPRPHISSLKVEHHDSDYTAVSFTSPKQKYILVISNDSANESESHSIIINGELVKWDGPYFLSPYNIN